MVQPVQPLQWPPVRAWELSCPPVHLLLGPGDGVARDSGGNELEFAQWVKRTSRGGETQTKIWTKAGTFPAKLQLTTLCSEGSRNQVSEDAMRMRISVYLFPGISLQTNILCVF